MAYDVALAERIAGLLKRRRGVTQKQMFGGVGFLVNGKMCYGVIRDKLVVRVGPEHYQQLLRKPHARPMNFTGRPLKGFVYVMPQGVRNRTALKVWLDLALRYVASLPAKRTSSRALAS